MKWIISNYLEFLRFIVLGVMVIATLALVIWGFASIITFAVCKYEDWFDRLVKESSKLDEELIDISEEVNGENHSSHRSQS